MVGLCSYGCTGGWIVRCSRSFFEKPGHFLILLRILNCNRDYGIPILTYPPYLYSAQAELEDVMSSHQRGFYPCKAHVVPAGRLYWRVTVSRVHFINQGRNQKPRKAYCVILCRHISWATRDIDLNSLMTQLQIMQLAKTAQICAYVRGQVDKDSRRQMAAARPRHNGRRSPVRIPLQQRRLLRIAS